MGLQVNINCPYTGETPTTFINSLNLSIHLFPLRKLNGWTLEFIMKQIRHTVNEITVAYKLKKRTAKELIIRTSADAAIYIMDGFDRNTIAMQEQFVVLYLNPSNCILGLYKASSGGLTGTVADIRIILSIGLKTLATSIVIAHYVN